MCHCERSEAISNGTTAFFAYNTEDCHGPSGLAMTVDGAVKVPNLKKQSQFTGLRPEIRNSKSEIRNRRNLEELFEKTKPIYVYPI